jgi:predicted nuclease with TOPRIM domain
VVKLGNSCLVKPSKRYRRARDRNNKKVLKNRMKKKYQKINSKDQISNDRLVKIKSDNAKLKNQLGSMYNEVNDLLRAIDHTQISVEMWADISRFKCTVESILSQ